MSTPPKPWEITGGMNGNREFIPQPNAPSSSDFLPNGVPQQVRQTRVAPPLPPRQQQSILRQLNMPASGNYFGSSYAGGYGSSYGGYGGYNSFGSTLGGYGGYSGYGMNRYGFQHPNNAESRFIQMAEEGSRPAFQSIESIVQAVGSVSFMLESTFNAMYSSFRAVLGVAENFGRLRSLFGQFLSVFAIFRWFRWMYRRCLYLLGLRKESPNHESVWNEATGAELNKPRSTWPIIFFLSIILTGPYLMWKLLSSLNIPSVDPNNVQDWDKCKEPMHAGVVMYDFKASSRQELSIQTGWKLVIAPKDCQPHGTNNWILATHDGKQVGLVPANYIRLIGRVRSTKESESKSSHNYEGFWKEVQDEAVPCIPSDKVDCGENEPRDSSDSL